ncbi:MAG: hypothetical protein AAGU76_02325 [Sedimentibacter sp.]|uniref:hypothetical protein n=1 Tax=Sedimentibacter sp. TaxID=1960295 RepID=UPI003158B123
MNYFRYNYLKPYTARNMLVRTAETPIPPEEAPSQHETGTLSVSVATALGALPVENAVVFVYRLLDSEENLFAQYTTDANGKIPDIELPVVKDPAETSMYYFTTYNLRVTSENYYTVNVLNFRIFPGVKTIYRIDMIPVIAGEAGTAPEQTFIIPPSPLDTKQ